MLSKKPRNMTEAPLKHAAAKAVKQQGRLMKYVINIAKQTEMLELKGDSLQMICC